MKRKTDTINSIFILLNEMLTDNRLLASGGGYFLWLLC